MRKVSLGLAFDVPVHDGSLPGVQILQPEEERPWQSGNADPLWTSGSQTSTPQHQVSLSQGVQLLTALPVFMQLCSSSHLSNPWQSRMALSFWPFQHLPRVSLGALRR